MRSRSLSIAVSRIFFGRASGGIDPACASSDSDSMPSPQPASSTWMVPPGRISKSSVSMVLRET